MKSLLDDHEYLNRLDPNGMLKAITDFPLSARKALENIENINFDIITDYDSILVAGMGGSAVGGLLLRDWLYDTLRVPITVNRGYHLPAWVDKKTLIYAVSYSGNTEETISQYHEALEHGCKAICFCSGGLLEEKANENQHILVKFPAGHQPRAAIPYQFYSLAGVMHKIGLIDEAKWEEVIESIQVVEAHCSEMKPEVPLELNPGKKLAEAIKGFVPFVYAPRLFTSVAYRYSTQFNENSKSPAGTNFYPEAFHNSVMAREGDKELLGKLCAVTINDHRGDEALNKKTTIAVDLMRESFGKIVTVTTRGDSSLARIMSALIQGDYTSAYLGILYGHDPSTTESIRVLKESMGP